MSSKLYVLFLLRFFYTPNNLFHFVVRHYSIPDSRYRPRPRNFCRPCVSYIFDFMLHYMLISLSALPRKLRVSSFET